MALADGYIGSLDRRLTSTEHQTAQNTEDVAVLKAGFQEIKDSISTMKNALYITTGTVAAAAISHLLF